MPVRQGYGRNPNSMFNPHRWLTRPVSLSPLLERISPHNRGTRKRVLHPPKATNSNNRRPWLPWPLEVRVETGTP